MPNLIHVEADAQIGAVARLEEVMVVAHDPRHRGKSYPRMKPEQAIELIRQLEVAVAQAIQNRERADRLERVAQTGGSAPTARRVFEVTQ